MSPSPAARSKKHSPLTSTPSSAPPSPPSGLIRLLPSALVPLAQLIRLDKPGFVHFLVPLLTGALLSADIRQTPPRELTSTLLTLSVFSLPLTFINFSWNDTLDASLDRRVRRTRDRPIARGAITIPQARVINSVLLGLCVAALWPASKETWVVGLIAGAGAAVYPFTKRWMMFPQLVFALVMAMGVLIGASADGSPPFFECDGFGGCRWKRLDRVSESTLWFYLANVAWNVGYEIVYSFQDVEDDEKAGSGSIAVVIKKRPMPLLWILAAMQTVCFACAGVVARAGPAYFISSVGVSGISMAAKLRSVDLHDPESCIWWFSRGVMLAGGSITLGLLIDYLTRVV